MPRGGVKARPLRGRYARLDTPSLAWSEEHAPDGWQKKSVFCLKNDALDAITRLLLAVVSLADTADRNPPG